MKHTNFVQNIAHKTEEGINKIVNKAKKVFIKDELSPEENIYGCNYNTETNVSKTTISNTINSSELHELKEERNNDTEVKYPSFDDKK